VRPDLVTFAKAVTSGYLPLGGVLVGAAVRAPLEGNPSALLRHGPSYSGHPTAAAAALANLDILESERLLERAARIGERLGKGLASLVDGEHNLEARGMLGIWALRTAAHLDAPALHEALIDNGVIAWPTRSGDVLQAWFQRLA
jgi:putrescine---pyruvate transaminase